MTSLRFSERSRAGLLLSAMTLIGGTGCITASIIEGAAQRDRQQQFEADRKRQDEALLSDARAGQPRAMTRVALLQLNGGRAGIPLDPAAGRATLEQLVARNDAGAEYALGRALVFGNGRIESEPQRGIALMKRAASHACKLSIDSDFPASSVSPLIRIFRYGTRPMPGDPAQAELWLARDAVHCREANINFYEDAALAPPQQQIRRLSFHMLAASPAVPQLQRGLTAEQIATAAAGAERLRRLVRESEADYPAPPPPSKKP